jgi:hypothetical protein
MNISWSVQGWILYSIQAYRVQNNIPTLYILEIDSSKVKRVKLHFSIFFRFAQKMKNSDRAFVLPWLTWREQRKPAFSHSRVLKIYDAADSTTRLQKKEICDARQKMWIICGPRGILNDFVMLSTTLN